MNATYSALQKNALPNNCCVENKPSPSITRLVSQSLKSAKTYLAARYARRVDREAIGELLSMDTTILDDIGISRGDVEWASKLPSSVSATTELEILARGGHASRKGY